MGTGNLASKRHTYVAWDGFSPETEATATKSIIRNGCPSTIENERIRILDDKQVYLELTAMKTENRDEYQALFDLAGDQHVHGLGGLPLALAQADIFIVRNKYSFAEYVEIYKK